MLGPLASRAKMPRITPKSCRRTGEGWPEPRRWSSEGSARAGPLASRTEIARTRTKSSGRARDGARDPRPALAAAECHDPRSPKPKRSISACACAPLKECLRRTHTPPAAARVSPTYWRSAAGEARQSATTSWTADIVPHLDFAATGRPAPRGAAARREHGGPRRPGHRSGSARAGVRAPLCRCREHRAPLALSRRCERARAPSGRPSSPPSRHRGTRGSRSRRAASPWTPARAGPLRAAPRSPRSPSKSSRARGSPSLQPPGRRGRSAPCAPEGARSAQSRRSSRRTPYRSGPLRVASRSPRPTSTALGERSTPSCQAFWAMRSGPLRVDPGCPEPPRSLR